MACAADEVVAQPGTLTGSIGVIIGKYVLRDMLSKIGVTHTAISARDTMEKAVLADKDDDETDRKETVSSQAEMLVSDPQQATHPEEEDKALIPYRTLCLRWSHVCSICLDPLDFVDGGQKTPKANRSNESEFILSPLFPIGEKNRELVDRALDHAYAVSC